jgi:hypothetical protein
VPKLETNDGCEVVEAITKEEDRRGYALPVVDSSVGIKKERAGEGARDIRQADRRAKTSRRLAVGAETAEGTFLDYEVGSESGLFSGAISTSRFQSAG